MFYEERNFGLCEGRHEIDGVTEYIFGNTIADPTDTEGLKEEALAFFMDNGVKSTECINIYVTGLTVALIAAINAAKEVGASVTLYHFDRETGNYFEQSVN